MKKIIMIAITIFCVLIVLCVWLVCKKRERKYSFKEQDVCSEIKQRVICERIKRHYRSWQDHASDSWEGAQYSFRCQKSAEEHAKDIEKELSKIMEKKL